MLSHVADRDFSVFAVESDSEEERISLVLDLARKLPDAHLRTLRFLMSHFARLCQSIIRGGNSCSPVKLLQPLAVSLIRPQWLKAE